MGEAMAALYDMGNRFIVDRFGCKSFIFFLDDWQQKISSERGELIIRRVDRTIPVRQLVSAMDSSKVDSIYVSRAKKQVVSNVIAVTFRNWNGVYNYFFDKYNQQGPSLFLLFITHSIIE